jgi:hypothetical protein
MNTKLIMSFILSMDRYLYKDPFLAYFPYLKKIKVG